MDPERNGTSSDRWRSPAERFPCWVEVDLDAVHANTRALRAFIGPRVRLAAVVKADGYGLGAVEVARTALAAGAELLAVARVSEGADLRRAGLVAPVLLLTAPAPAEVDEVVRWRLTPTVTDGSLAARLAAAARTAGLEVPVHLKVDTGLSRYGAPPDEAEAVAHLVRRLDGLRLEGLYTHFACSDEGDFSFTDEQLRRFQAFRARLVEQGFAIDQCHAASSAATLASPDTHLDLVRPGIALFGEAPGGRSPVTLRTAVALKARVARLHRLAPGATVGYGRTFVVERPTLAALVTAGYADGVPRALSNRGSVLVRGCRAPLIGRVSMDQCVVDVTDVPGVAPGDEVVFFGGAGEGAIPLAEFAAQADTIGHEALCRIGPRVPRLYRDARHGLRPLVGSSAGSLRE